MRLEERSGVVRTFMDAAAPTLPRDPFGALVSGRPAGAPRHAPAGPLAGLSFVAKDLFDVAGLPTGAGCPEWAATHPVPKRSASAVTRLLDAGAELCGKTVTDELAYSLSGTDSRQGAPINPACSDRVPGGSSSGSAVAVASGLADLALGTDTGGSVRAPASYCGILGLRPTHGRIAADGVVPLAPSFDTVGLFARDVGILARAAHVLLDGAPAADHEPAELLVAADAFAGTDPRTAAALAPAVEAAAGCFGRASREVELAPPSDDLAACFAAFRAIQGREAWKAQGEWITHLSPALGPNVAERLASAATVSAEEAEEADVVRARAREHLLATLGGGGVLCLPATADPPPPRDLPADEVQGIRTRSLRLLSPAGLAGAPTLVLPAAEVDGCPVGLALLGPPGSDEALLRLGAELAGRLRDSGPAIGTPGGT